jgi:hypothetical protein
MPWEKSQNEASLLQGKIVPVGKGSRKASMLCKRGFITLGEARAAPRMSCQPMGVPSSWRGSQKKAS